MNAAGSWHRLCLAESVSTPPPRDLSSGQLCLETVPTAGLDHTRPEDEVGAFSRGIPACSLELQGSTPASRRGPFLGCF